MEFRYQYMVVMQDQNPKMYRRLRDSGELDRFVNLKAQEASKLYHLLLSQGPQPPTLMSQREAAERVKAMMFEFPDDTGTAKQDETKALFHEEPPQGQPMPFSSSQHLNMAALLDEKAKAQRDPTKAKKQAEMANVFRTLARKLNEK
jgi:hypothetical protein